MSSAKSYAHKLGRLHESVPMESFFTSDHFCDVFDKELIASFMDQLTPRNAYYIMTTKENKDLKNI